MVRIRVANFEYKLFRWIDIVLDMLLIRGF